MQVFCQTQPDLELYVFTPNTWGLLQILSWHELQIRPHTWEHQRKPLQIWLKISVTSLSQQKTPLCCLQGLQIVDSMHEMTFGLNDWLSFIHENERFPLCPCFPYVIHSRVSHNNSGPGCQEPKKAIWTGDTSNVNSFEWPIKHDTEWGNHLRLKMNFTISSMNVPVPFSRLKMGKFDIHITIIEMLMYIRVV